MEWECVTTSGKSPGKISHHTCFAINDKEVIFYGGLKGDDSNADIFMYNALGSSWTTIPLSGDFLPRDDHAMSDAGDGSFVVFGGFVNGSRVDEVLTFTHDGGVFKGDQLYRGDANGNGPVVRASHSNVVYHDKLYVFGGQDDDNNKLGDLWTFDRNSRAWEEVRPGDGGFQPIARSGHTAVVWGQKMYIFGGILELTKELNDMVVFDFASGQFVAGDNANDQQNASPAMPKGAADSQFQESSSPARTQKGTSPTKRKTLTQTTSPTLKPKGKLGSSPDKKAREGEGGAKQEGLSSPTSISMQNTFLIKNADQSFDAYYQQMRKRKAGQHFGTHADHNVTGHGEGAKFGLIRGQRPTARDGHCAIVDS